MAAKTYLEPVVEGQTKPLVHQLLSNGEAVTIQDLDVVLYLEKSDGTMVDTSGKVTNLDDGTADNRGKVQFDPDAEDFVVAGSDYSLRWQVTDGDGKIEFWPSGRSLAIKVYAVTVRGG